jgi:hypothetical protein
MSEPPNHRRPGRDAGAAAGRPARLTRGGRRLFVCIQHTWPWAHELAAAFARLAAQPVPTN